jgi:hypothetical protein
MEEKVTGNLQMPEYHVDLFHQKKYLAKEFQPHLKPELF